MNKNLTIALAAIVALMVFGAITAFQTPTQKFGVVNLGDLAEKSKLGAREKKNFEDLRTRLSTLIQFINTNKVMKRDELNKLDELWRNEKPTPDQTKELEALKTTVQKNSEELRRLISILNPSADEQAKIRELSALAQGTEDALQSLDGRYGQIMQARASEKQAEVLKKSRDAVQKLGKRDGYTLIFEINTTPFGANDVTDAALKIMDTDNP